MGSKKISARLVIWGRVQGVLFRRYAKEEAEKLGLVGWIRNKNDGSVGCLVEGEEDKIDKFIVWCKKGPELAIVDKVDVEKIEETGNFSGFQVL